MNCFNFFDVKPRVDVSEQLMYFFCYSIQDHKNLSPDLSV